MTAVGETVFFLTPRALWTSDGTAAGTQLVHDFGAVQSVQPLLAAAEHRIYILASESSPQVWTSDGTAAGTRAVTTYAASDPLRQTAWFKAAGDVVYFVADDVVHGAEISTSDGTVAGTHAVTDFGYYDPFELPGDPSFADALTAAGASLYFLMSGSIVGSIDVWSSDGTAAGTHEVATGGFYQGSAPQFTAVGDLVFFSDGGVWATDGTTAGTVRVYGAGHSGPVSSLTSWRGALYFLAENAGELWRSDGTPAGTVRVATLGPGSTLDVPNTGLMAATADRLFLLADDGVHGQEPWTSDGTASGTLLLRDVNPGVASSSPAGLTVAGDRVFFSADDGVHGNEPWVSDGTPAGTRLAADVAPEALSSNPTGFSVAGDRLYFAADDGLHGQELWALALSGQTGCQATAAALCLAGGRFRVEAEWRDFQGNIGQCQTLPLTGDTGAFWFFSPANVEVVIKVISRAGTGRQGPPLAACWR